VSRCWRLLGTGIAFATFGLGGLVLAYLIIPCIWLLPSKQAKKYAAQAAISRTFACFTLLLRLLRLGSVDFIGFEKLADDKGCLWLANHPTLLDYVFIVSRLRRCDTMVKAALWDNFFLSGAVKAAGYIPNRRDASTFEAIDATLTQGHNLLMFPECTRSRAGQRLKLERGAAQVAVRLTRPIRLISIHCRPTILEKGEKWYKISKEKPKLTITVGPRLEPSTFIDEGRPYSILARELTRTLTEYFERER